MRPTLMVSSATALTEASAMHVATINLHHIALSLLAYPCCGHNFDARHHLFAPIGMGAIEMRLGPPSPAQTLFAAVREPASALSGQIATPATALRGKAGPAAHDHAASAVDCRILILLPSR